MSSSKHVPDKRVFHFPSVDACPDEEDESCFGSSTSFSTNLGDESVDSIQEEDDFLSFGKSLDETNDFLTLKWSYLIVTFITMLADGLQGTHLYVLYESYGYSVASLYCLGFLTGAILSPITGQIIDKFGRKKAAVLYCILEMTINCLEQYPGLAGIIASRMIGGFTTNLLSSVFETWLDTEFRRRQLPADKFELIHRDSVIVSNCAAVASGFLSHALAVKYGAVGPFKGAVTCTTLALVVVTLLWTENFGHALGAAPIGMAGYFREAIEAYRSDTKMLRVGIIQGFSEGSINVFIFLWSPTLTAMAKMAKSGSWGLDQVGLPAYGLIFGAFMASGVLGGVAASWFRRKVCLGLCLNENKLEPLKAAGTTQNDGPAALEFLASVCYMCSASLLALPSILKEDLQITFSVCLAAFLVFEFLIGMLKPYETVIRSLYFPCHARASIMSIPRIIVNLIVSVGVISTNFVSVKTVFSVISSLMFISAILQLSFVSKNEWDAIYSAFTSCKYSKIFLSHPCRRSLAMGFRCNSHRRDVHARSKHD